MHLKGDVDQNFQALVRTLSLQSRLPAGDRGWHVTALLTFCHLWGTALQKGREKLGEKRSTI